jgi:hypothetical protein
MTRSEGRLGETDIFVDQRRLRTLMLLTGEVPAHDTLTLGPSTAGIFDLGGTGQQLDADATLVRGDLIVADSNPYLTLLNHPGAAGYAFTTDAADVVWDQTPTWTGLHTFNAGLLIGAGQTADLNGEADALVLDADGDTTLSAPTDDQIDIEISGADDFTFTANSFNVLSGSAITMADDTYIGLGAAAGRLVFDATPAPDQVEVTAADLYFATASHGIIHVDGNTAGNVLRADGTRYVPAAAASTLPVAPGARGHILRGEAGPVWASYNAATNGAALVGDGTDVISDTTPAWSGLHTFNAGLLIGAGQTADLNGEADALVLDADGDTTLSAPTDDRIDVEISGADDFTFTANSLNVLSGSAITMADETWIGLASDAGRLVFDTTPTPDQIEVTAADLYFASASHGIIHVDGVAAGMVLRADGTRYVPAAANAYLPVAPGARGHILRGEAGPVWASYDAATAGAVLIGDGTDITADTTPTLVGALTMDDGAGDSPALRFVGGSNDDTALIYLDDDGTATDSDLVIQLCDTGGDSVLAIHDSTPAAVLEIDSNGNLEIQNDNVWIGRGAAAARIEFVAAGTEVALYDGTDLTIYSDAGVTQVGLWDGATGNITLVDDAWIGLGAAAARVTFDSTGNSVDLYSAADLRLFSDAGVTQVGLWDGATGNILLDDGAGDSPQIQFIGGTNDDTILLYLLDNPGGAGDSDLVIQLADTSGDSKVIVRNSTPADVIELWSNGNIQLDADGARIANTGGVTLEFDATNNWLEITGGYVGLGTTTPIGMLHIDQSSTTGARPVVTMDQADLDCEYLRLIGTAASPQTGYALVSAGDYLESAVQGWFKIYIQDDGDRITDGYYWVPFHAEPSGI